MSGTSDTKVLYEDETWRLCQRHNTYLLLHNCDPGEHPAYDVRRGRNSSFTKFKNADFPCSYCKSVCPESLQGLYNMLVYL